MRRISTCFFLFLSLLTATVWGQENSLRNSGFQDDWLTLLAENKNHNWNYSNDFYHRRDFNPDGWELKGSWRWVDAEAPWGRRKLVVQGPEASVGQQVNWMGVHDSKALSGFPDAGGYPTLISPRSLTPEKLVRDATFRVRLKGTDVPPGAGEIEAAWVAGGGVSLKNAAARTALPAGTFDWQWLEVKLPAQAYLQALGELGKDPKEAAMQAQGGMLLPATIAVALRYKAATGTLEIEQAQLLPGRPDGPNLLPSQAFTDKDGSYRQEKYRYFPPGYYYIFNTWHNAGYENRGPVVADELVRGQGPAIKMIVAAGDEKSITSAPIVLNQDRPRLLEVTAWVKTDQLAMMQIDALDEKGQRLDAFNFIHKMPVSIGSDSWRLVRQVFRPRQAVQTLRLQLAARGINGFTLGGTGLQPQNNVVGTIWWSNLRLYEPESSAAELEARKVRTIAEEKKAPANQVYVAQLDLGERLLGENLLQATLLNSGDKKGTFSLQWEYVSPTGVKTKVASAKAPVGAGQSVDVALTYTLTEPCPAYREYRGVLTLLNDKDKAVASSELWFATWTTPMDVEIGSAYLRPDQAKQFVRLNLGLTAAMMARAGSVKLEVIRRGNGQVLQAMEVPATPAALAAQRERIPMGLREDFTNLLLADLDVSALPVQPFDDPQRNWLVRATLRDAGGKTLVGPTDSAWFCRQAHEKPQAAIQSVSVKKGNLLEVNGQPWMPWGVTYGHNPVYDGPADAGAGHYRDLHNLPAWGIYDRHGGAAASRANNDLNCLRYVAAGITPRVKLEELWAKDNLYASSAYVVPEPVWSMEELIKGAGGKEKLDAYLAFCKAGPMVVSTALGVEEAFSLFSLASAEQIKGMEEVAGHVRQVTGKPVMVGHGGYWNRFEFEKVLFYDIFDPETEPLYPANLHTDMMPLIGGQAKAVWLRPQMYENVPYERWRYHVWVELMRGARGWQIAHGPGDVSLFRGLHGEMEFIKAAAYSQEQGPAVRVEPWIEHWTRRVAGKTYVVAATTRGLTLGRWRWSQEAAAQPMGRVRVSGGPDQRRSEDNAYGIGQEAFHGPSISGIQNLPDAQAWPAGSKLVQWVRLDPQALPANLAVLAKADGRWSHAAGWGGADFGDLQKDAKKAAWFLRAFYRHASGFLGWGDEHVGRFGSLMPSQALAMGALPEAGRWVKLEVALDKLGATDKLLDGVGFWHEGGQVQWGHTLLVGPDGSEKLVWGDAVGLPASSLGQVKIHVASLKTGAKVRVLFEDREIQAKDGYFVDDFRGQDLYQRYGGGPGIGYGDEPVSLHVYEIR